MYFIVGPCSLESLDQVRPVVELCQRWNIRYFRAQLFKPRTHPRSFQGLGKNGLPIIEYLKSQNLKLVAEACDLEQLYVVKDYADMIQIGARNMQNFELLKRIGRVVDFKEDGPKVLLKRGFGNTYQEWLSSADYLLDSGVPRKNIVLCERGSRNAFGPTGMDLDLALALYVKQNSDFDVVVDPSHGSRNRDLVLPLSLGAKAMGFDGLMIEIHPNPSESLSDKEQAVGLDTFEKFLEQNDLSDYGVERVLVDNLNLNVNGEGKIAAGLA